MQTGLGDLGDACDDVGEPESQASGSMSLRRAIVTSVIMTAARSARDLNLRTTKLFCREPGCAGFVRPHCS